MLTRVRRSGCAGSLRKAPEQDRGSFTFALVVAGAFLGIAALSVSHHELWRDELQSWLIARDSGSLWQLHANLRREGHPGLWHALLAVLSHAGFGVRSMQVANTVLAAIGVFLFAWFAPWSPLVRALFAIGYFPVYEWGTLARNYAIAMPLLFGFCVAHIKRHGIVSAVLVVLAAQGSVHALILAGGCVTVMLFDDRPAALGDSPGTRQFAAAMAGAAILVSAILLVPPAGTRAAGAPIFATLRDRVVGVFRIPGSALLPIPALHRAFWNIDAFAVYPGWPVVKLVIGATSLTVCTLFIARRISALVGWVVAAGGLLALFAVLHFGYMRHHGFIFLAFVVFAWVAHAGDVGTSVSKPRGPELAMLAIMTVQAFGGAVAMVDDRRYVFSAAEATAELVRSGGLAGAPLAVDHENTGAAIVALLDARSAYFPRPDRDGSFAVWAAGQRDDVDGETILRRVQQRALDQGRDVTLIVDWRIPGGVLMRVGIRLVGCRRCDTIGNEQFCVYVVPAHRPSDAAR